MDSNYEALIQEYASELDIYKLYYTTMGALLDKKRVAECFMDIGAQGIYIYGGSFLGVQLLNALEGTGMVKGIVDKSGKTKCPVEGTTVMDLVGLKKAYDNELVVITVFQHHSKIRKDLDFVSDEKVKLITELL